MQKLRRPKRTLGIISLLLWSAIWLSGYSWWHMGKQNLPLLLAYNALFGVGVIIISTTLIHAV